MDSAVIINLFSCYFQRFLGTQVMCLHFVQGPEMTHAYSINILSLQLTLLIKKMLQLSGRMDPLLGRTDPG
jgi:hypothetical protein